MSASLGLFRLQKVDSRISQIEMRLARIRETLDDDADLRAAGERVKNAETNQHTAERALHQLEAEAQDQQIKIQQAEASLYGGSIHNPKELQDFQADVNSLKKQLASLEERQLEAMLTLETTQAELKTQQLALENVQAQAGSERQHLIDEQSQLMRDMESLQAERQAAVSAVADELLKTYEALRQQRRGIAVAEVADNTCAACGTTLTAALQQSARHTNELVRCPSCGRILYAA